MKQSNEFPTYTQLLENYYLTNKTKKKEPEEPEATLEFTAGALLRNQIRFQLEKAQFKGATFKFIESRHLFDSLFVIKGKKEEVSAVYNWLQKI